MPRILEPEKARDIFLEAISKQNRLVVAAPTGWGKSTLLPLWASEVLPGRILISEPRRVAAWSLAAYVSERLAQSLGERAKGLVGYIIRFDHQEGSRICYVTEGILLQMIQKDPSLSGVSAVFVDEFHERGIFTDTIVGLLLEVSKARSDLRLVILSATIDGLRVAERIGGQFLDFGASAIWETPDGEIVYNGRFAVEVRYRPESDILRIIEEIEAADPSREGSVLVFLPGKPEISEMEYFLRTKLGDDFYIVPLHGEQDVAEQKMAFMTPPPGIRKIVLATNVAETSITVPDVRFVIDLGWEKVSRFLPSGFRALVPERISRSSAVQRAGRAGRTGPGVVFRLWPRSEPLAESRTPEILREDLTSVLLYLKRIGVSHPEELQFPDPPPPERWAEAQRVLHALGAIDERGEITPLGRSMAELPLTPRLARMVLEVVGSPELDLILQAVSVVSVGKPVLLPLDRLAMDEAMAIIKQRDELMKQVAEMGSDLFLGAMLLERFRENDRAGLEQLKARKGTLIEANKIYEQIKALLREHRITASHGKDLDPARACSAIAAGLADQILVRFVGSEYALPDRHERVLIGRESALLKRKHMPDMLAPWEIREIQTRKRNNRILIATGNTAVDLRVGLHLVRSKQVICSIRFQRFGGSSLYMWVGVEIWVHGVRLRLATSSVLVPSELSELLTAAQEREEQVISLLCAQVEQDVLLNPERWFGGGGIPSEIWGWLRQALQAVGM